MTENSTSYLASADDHSTISVRNSFNYAASSIACFEFLVLVGNGDF